MTIPRTLRLCLATLALSSTLLLASVADAQQAYVYTRTSLRAGPDSGYPQVAWIGSGATVYVHGCVRGYHWCDITSGPFRGWANARHLQYFYNNQRLIVYGHGARFGLPLIGYSAGSYWDNYYRGQSWYGRRDHWNNWRPGTPAPHFNGYAPGHPQYHAQVAPPHAGFAPHQPQLHQARPPQVVHPQQMHAPVQHAQHAQHSQPARAMGQQQHGNGHQNGVQR